MSRETQATVGRPALDLLEEAVHLLRGAGVGVWLQYYVGSVPFALALLFFWADMSCGVSADQRCAPAALGLMAAFLWMKCWHSVFAGSLRAQLTGTEPPPWNRSRVFRLACVHAALQGSGLLLLPVAFVLVIPFPVVFACYQNLTLLADGNSARLRPALARAASEAVRWSMQNWHLVAVLLLFGLFAFINVVTGLQLIPFLLKTFLGLETAFTRSPQWTLFNTTYLASAAIVTWLGVDPLIKAVYLLRCFFGVSLESGEDLKASLRHARLARGALTAALLLVALHTHAAPATNAALTAPTATAEPAQVSPRRVESQTAVKPAELNPAIDRQLEQPEFTWRQPREQIEEPEPGGLRKFVMQTGDAIRKTAKRAYDVLRRFYYWWKDKFDRWFPAKSSRNGDRSGWQSGVQTVVVVLLAATVGLLVVLLIRLYRARRRTPIVTAQGVVAQPDVADENVTADQLPEDDWLALARDLAARGELRLALRAMYLASLAHLSRRDLVFLARFKSNHDYELELRRRARAWPDLQRAFTENLGAFERIWYGTHEINSDGVRHFEENVRRIRANQSPPP